MRRTLALASMSALALALAATTAACGGEEDGAGGADAVSVGVIPIVDVAPIYLGIEQGFFAARDIELELTAAQGGAAIVPGVAAGEFDFGFSNITSLLLAQSSGLPIEIVANGVASTGVAGEDFGAVMVPADSPIQTAADLADATVAVNTLNNIGDTTVRESVRIDGGDPTGIGFTEIAFPDMPAQLSAGNVDAAWVVEPFKSLIEAEGGRPVAWNYVDAAPDLTVAAYFATSQLVQEDPDLVQRFADAIAESLQYATDNPEAVRDILGTYTDISPEIRAALTLPAFPAAVNKDSVERLAELGEADGIFENPPDVDALLP
ncbi:NitT/TauT family transport system substrate-binding protein [Glycomyces sambucus]|uniref:NitT/TauT family transport system substrate-binding protein n=1 Tax=Glycomyces sambucus TaxID=380244 RepID=A0A1G9KWD5_9ACTN|nr:ABC transporter substrate-binding protein [Glycomyces sambucus]SDL54038.1 NitT/TauT family transport system substrate-binding protein [Glycomyces sambucus]